MTRRFAAAIGFVVAPLVAAIALVLMNSASGELTLFEFLGWAAIGYCFTLPAALIVGVPMFCFLNNYGAVAWWTAAMGGALTGGVADLIVSSSVHWYFVISGGIAGFSFWVIWRMGTTSGS